MANQLGRTSPAVLGILALLLVLTPMLGFLVARVPTIVSVAIVVGISVFILSFVSTRFALYILIFATLLSPEFGTRTTSGSGVTVRVDDFLLLLIGFGQLARAAVYREVGLFSWTPLNRYITFYMLACAIATGAGILFGRVRFITGFFFVLKYFEYFIVYFMLVNNLDSKEQAKRFLVAIFLTAAIVSLVAVAQIPSGGRVVAPFEGDQGEPNTLGGYLLLVASIVGGVLLHRDAVQGFRDRFALMALLGLIFIPILFTLSRATWLAAIPVYLAFLVLSHHRVLLGLVGVAALIVAPYAMPEAVVKRIFYTVETERSTWAQQQQEEFAGITFDTSSSARIRSWKYALKDFPKHPILGYGVTGWRFIDAQYLRVLLETGLLGLSAFLLLIWVTLKQSWHTYRTVRDPLFQGVAMGFIVGTLALLAHALMANTFIIVRIMEPYWLLAAIVIAAPSLQQAETEAEAPLGPAGEGTPPQAVGVPGIVRGLPGGMRPA